MDFELLAKDNTCENKPWCPSVSRAWPGKSAVVGKQITDPADLGRLGVGPGECGLLIDEALILKAADEIRRRDAA